MVRPQDSLNHELNMRIVIPTVLVFGALFGGTTIVSQQPTTPRANLKTFTNAAFSIQFPSDWSIAMPQADPLGNLESEGLMLRKGPYVVAVSSAMILQASGVDGGRLPEYLSSGVLDVSCMWSEGLPIEPTIFVILQNGMKITD